MCLLRVHWTIHIARHFIHRYSQWTPNSSMEDITLQWRHNDRDDVSNHRRPDCFTNHLFRHKSKKISTLRVTGLCEGNSPLTGEFPAQRASNAENVSIRWRHHELWGVFSELKSISYIDDVLYFHFFMFCILFNWTALYWMSRVYTQNIQSLDTNIWRFFYPRPVLLFGYCRCLRASVSLSARPSVCQPQFCRHDNLTHVQARVTKFGPKV